MENKSWYNAFVRRMLMLALEDNLAWHKDWEKDKIHLSAELNLKSQILFDPWEKYILTFCVIVFPSYLLSVTS